MGTQMQLKVLFVRKSHGRTDFYKKKSRVFFGVIFYVYTNVDNRETARASYWKFVGRKTWKFKAAVRKWEMLAASKVKMSRSEK